MENEMNANLGTIDRVIRIVLGLALIVVPLLNIPVVWTSSILSYGSIAVGLVLVATGFFRFCPVYRILGVSTCKR
ncbi:MAG: hypothetical protein ACJARC_000216 [Sulfitobacter sp.]|jgi:hypothetical protein